MTLGVNDSHGRWCAQYFNWVYSTEWMACMLVKQAAHLTAAQVSNQGSHISGLTNFPDFSSIFTIFPVFIPVLIFQSMTSTYYWVIVLQTGSHTVVNLLHHTYYLYNTQ